MVARAKAWKMLFKEGLEQRLPDPPNRTAFVKAMVEATELSPQAIYKWFSRQQISDTSLEAVAKHFSLDYPALRLYGTFIPASTGAPAEGRRRRKADAVQEAAAGYEVALPTGPQMSARWDRLPNVVKGFLLSQIESFEQLYAANPDLARLMFSTPNGDTYKKWEASLSKPEARKQRS